MRPRLLPCFCLFTFLGCSPPPAPATSPSTSASTEDTPESSKVSGANGTPPSLETVRAAIDAMVNPNLPVSYRVLNIAGPVEGWAAVAIDPPYREFPNVVLFHEEEGKWRRVREGLGLGVQPYPSPFLDLHTVGFAMDMGFQGPGPMPQDAVMKMMEIAEQTKLNVVIHGNMMHQHPAGAQGYFLDRRPAEQAITQLFPEFPYDPRAQCLVTDYPPLEGVTLSKRGDAFAVIAKTRSGQYWMVSWTGLGDEDLLVGGKIGVSWGKDRQERLPRRRTATPQKCKGEASPELLKELQERALQAAYCPDVGPEKHPDLHGKLRLLIQIDDMGRLAYAAAIDDPLGTPTVTECALGSFYRPYLNPGAAPCVEVQMDVAIGEGHP